MQTIINTEMLTNLYLAGVVVGRETKKTAEAKTDNGCISPDGFFPDPKQCDKYYACR